MQDTGLQTESGLVLLLESSQSDGGGARVNSDVREAGDPREVSGGLKEGGAAIWPSAQRGCSSTHPSR